MGFRRYRADRGRAPRLLLGQNWGLTLRTWYFQTDAKEEGDLSGSDLSFVGVALELLARWPVSERWALYGSLGPASP